MARTRANRPPTANIPVVPARAQLNKRAPFPTAIAWEEVSSSRGGLPTETDHGQHPVSDMPGPRLRSHLHSPARRNHPTNRSPPIRRNPLRSRHRPRQAQPCARPAPTARPPTDPPAQRSDRVRRASPEPHRGHRRRPGTRCRRRTRAATEVRTVPRHAPSHLRHPQGLLPRLGRPSASARRASSQKGRSPARFMSPVMPARQFASTGSSRFDCRVGPHPDGRGRHGTPRKG